MFYCFRQNNSGGVWKGHRYVIIEADSPDEANTIAEQHGVYFDGISKGMDCGCCGNRWHRVYDDEAEESPKIYGDPLEDYDSEDYLLVRKTPTGFYGV